MSVNSPILMANQAEEQNKNLPKAVKAEGGNTLLQVTVAGQMVLGNLERQTSNVNENTDYKPRHDGLDSQLKNIFLGRRSARRGRRQALSFKRTRAMRLPTALILL